MAYYSVHTLPARRQDYNITEKIHHVLTERECSIFDKGLAVYHKRRDVTGFVESLSMVLNTNQKRQLLIPIRDSFVKPSDLVKFNTLCIKFGVALPARGTMPKKQQKKLTTGDDISGPKLIEVKRNQNGEWGFSVRGGIEVGMGIFVSWIDHDSNAEKAGLRIGDYIHRVDDTNFDGFSQTEASQFFRNRRKIALLVTSYGKIPGFQPANKFYRWVDKDGKPTPPPLEDGDLLMDVPEKKVTMTIEQGMELGISIRGGAEHGLAIYVSAVDPASLADLHGIEPGDHILEVNGIVFYNILHSDAAKALRSQRTLVMKVKRIGKIPTSRIPMPHPSQPEPRIPSPPSQMSLYSNTRGNRSKERTSEIASAPIQNGDHPVLLKKSVSPAKSRMNEAARAVLNKVEMSAFTYYTSQYEHEQIGVQTLVNKLLKLFNTRDKMQLFSDVREVIRSHDLDLFDELTIHKEIKSRKQEQKHLSGSISSHSDDDEGFLYPVQLRQKKRINVEENDDDLDEIPVKLSPIAGKHKTSTPDQQLLIAKKMRERRHKMHESILTVVEDDGWEETDVSHRGTSSMQMNEATFQSRLKKIEEEMKQKHEEEKQKLLEEKQKEFETQKEELESKIKEQNDPVYKAQLEEELRQKIEQNLKRDVEDKVRREALQELEREFKVKLEESLREEKEKADRERKKREELELEMRGSFKKELESAIRLETKNAVEQEFDTKLEKSVKAEQKRTEAEMKRREELEKEVKATMKQQLEQQKEFNEKLEKTIQEERKRLEEERKKREETEKEMLKKAAEELEEKEKLRVELENKVRNEVEQKAKRDYEEVVHRESREKDQLKEKLEEERKLREKFEQELREKERQEKEKKGRRKTKEKQHKTEPRLERTAAVEEDDEEEEQERQRMIAEERQLRKLAEEERRLKRLQEEEEELLRQEQIAERRRQEVEQEQKRQEQLERRRREEEKLEKQRQRQEQERARLAEEERLQQLREEEERRQREEEEERLAQQEQERRRKEVELRKKKEQVVTPPVQVDPSVMDDLVSEMAKISPVPSPQAGHVTFEDQRTKQQGIIEMERKKAEMMLAEKIRKTKETSEEEGGHSFGGYKGLKGKIIKVNVTKVNRKLGIAVDGGENTNQKAVIIRQIVPEGSAAQTSGDGMKIGHQILTVNGKSLKGLKHKDAVMAIKTAFDGPLNKVIEFVLHDPDDDDD